MIGYNHKQIEGFNIFYLEADRAHYPKIVLEFTFRQYYFKNN